MTRDHVDSIAITAATMAANAPISRYLCDFRFMAMPGSSNSGKNRLPLRTIPDVMKLLPRGSGQLLPRRLAKLIPPIRLGNV